MAMKPGKKVRKGGPKAAWKKKRAVGKTHRDKAQIQQFQDSYDQVDTSKVKTFADLPISKYTLDALTECEYTEPTEIQRESIMLALRGLDVLGAAKTGSGKTLAFVVPILERLFASRWSRELGLGALVITPTRELAYQIFETLRKVGKNHDFSAGLVIGGKDIHHETSRLSSCNIIVCTPGRILQHMDENPDFDPSTLQILVLDEADRCLDMGFAPTMNAIVENLPTEGRQTLLFSATQTRSVKDLARLSLTSPVYVSVHEHSTNATPDQLSQNYAVCELGDKLNMLWSFVKSHKRKKLLVFVQSCKQAKYFTELFKRLRCGTTVLGLYGTLHQLRRMAIYDEFCEKDGAACMFATDIAARGLDFPAVDWVIQYDCPEDATTYLHRVGRTARNAAVGQSLLVLLPSEETGMSQQLRAHKIPVDKIEVNPKKMTDIHRKIQAHLASDTQLKESAQRAFQAYLKSVYLLKNKHVFDVFKLDTAAFASSLGLAVPPRVRFLERQIKNKSSNKTGLTAAGAAREAAANKKTRLVSDSEDDDEDGGNDVLTVKRRDHDIDDPLDGEGETDQNDATEEVTTTPGTSKVLTKAALAKKALRKNLRTNQVIQFDEEGHGVDIDVSIKKSKEGQEYDDDKAGGGIDISKAKEVMRAEDKFDRQAEKERVRQRKLEEKRKRKEAEQRRRKGDQMEGDEDSGDSESEGDEPNLDWLPDPDKIYGPEGGQKDSGDEASGNSDDDSGSSSSSSEENSKAAAPKRKWKPPKKPQAGQKKRKREVEEHEEDENEQLDVLGAEAMVLQLLKR